MITVKQVKDKWGGIFVKGDVVENTGNRERITIRQHGEKYVNVNDYYDSYQVVSFTDRKHISNEMPCDGGLPIFIVNSCDEVVKGLAKEFEWNPNTYYPVKSWKPDLESLEKLANEKEEKPMTPSRSKAETAISTLDQLGYTFKGGELWEPPVVEKQYTYELVTDLDTNGIAKAMIDGEVFYTRDGSNSFKWNGERFVTSGDSRISVNGDFYRKVEKEIDWREEVCNYVNSLPQTYEPKLTLRVMNKSLLDFKSNTLSEKEFLEMCRVALRATGELE